MQNRTRKKIIGLLMQGYSISSVCDITGRSYGEVLKIKEEKYPDNSTQYRTRKLKNSGVDIFSECVRMARKRGVSYGVYMQDYYPSDLADGVIGGGKSC